MPITLHRCRAGWLRNELHACWRVQRALDEAGVEYRVAPGPLRKGRRDELARISGQRVFPVIEFEDGRTYRAESAEMAERIVAGRLFA